MQFNNPPSAKEMKTKKKHMKTITKFIFGFPMLALACGSIAFAQNQFAPLTPADSAAKAAAAAQREAAVGGTPTPPPPVEETVRFPSRSAWHLTVKAVHQFGLVITGASFQKSPNDPVYLRLIRRAPRGNLCPLSRWFRLVIMTSRSRTHDPVTLNGSGVPAATFEIIGGGKICKEVRDYLAYMNYPSIPP